MANDREERIVGFLLGFVDFLYAVLFGFILQRIFEDVVTNDQLMRSDKLVRIALVAGVFYFLLGDWIQGRLLTLRNPYRRYRRFFVEVGIAFAGFGAAIEAIRANVFFVGYIALVFLLGAYWAHSTLTEYPRTEDRRELLVIQVVQLLTAVTGGVSSLLWYTYVGELIFFGGLSMLYFIGWTYDFAYELFAPLRVGLEGGPGVPFVGREHMNRLKTFLRINP